MLEIGLQCPILIRVVEGEDGIGNSIVLVAGATRLAAAKKLEWDKIEAIEINGDEIDADQSATYHAKSVATSGRQGTA